MCSVWVGQKKAFEIGVPRGHELPNLKPIEEQQVVLINEPPLQHLVSLSYFHNHIPD